MRAPQQVDRDPTRQAGIGGGGTYAVEGTGVMVAERAEGLIGLTYRSPAWGRAMGWGAWLEHGQQGCWRTPGSAQWKGSLPIREFHLTAKLVTGASAAAAVLLAGCGTVSSSSHAQAAAAKPAGSSAASALPAQHPVPASVANSDLLRKQVAITACAAIPGGWEAKGTATNPAATSITYRITIFFTTPQATVLDDAVTTVLVQPGKTATWAASQKFTTVSHMNCVLRGVAAGS